MLHKWYVLVYGLKFGVPFHRLIIHDWSKFTRAEWMPYVNRFMSGRAGQEDKSADDEAFHRAWDHHWQHNAHHWEYWWHRAGWTPDAHRGDATAERAPNGVGLVLEMPEAYVREMVTDWHAAGRAYGGNIYEWYARTRDRQVMHPKTRARAEHLLGLDK